MSDPLPRAVAGGLASRGDGDAVSPRRIGLAAGILAALWLLVAYSVKPLPSGALALVGVGTDDFAHHGGLHLVWEPPAGYDVQRLRSRSIPIGTRLALRDHDVVLDVPRIAPADLEETAHRIATAQVEFHEVLETDEMKHLARVLELPMHDAWPVDADIDAWREETSQLQHTDLYLHGERAAIEGKLAAAAAAGWKLPPHTHIVYEKLEGDRRGAAWRTYVVSDTVEIDGDDIASASGSFDPMTERPTVLLELTKAARERFAALTTRITGHKLATMVGGEVYSAPVIIGPITGGRASVTMHGGDDPTKQEHERDMIVATLRGGVLPAGGHVSEASYVAPENGEVVAWLVRLALVLGGGLAVGGAAFVVIAKTRPRRVHAVARPDGPFPWGRLAITLVAPLAFYVASKVHVLGLVPANDYTAFGGGANEGAGGFLGMFNRPAPIVTFARLGLAPILSAWILVEAIAMLVPAARRRRHAGEVARWPLWSAVVVLALVLVVLDGWFVTVALEASDQVPYSMLARLLVIGSLAIGTLVFAAVAWLVRTRGLGNGFGALLASSWAVLGVQHAADMPSWGERAVTLATLVAIALIVRAMLRWRVGNAREAALRVPSSGTVALAAAGGLVAIALLLRALPLDGISLDLDAWADDLRGSVALVLGVVAGMTVLWSFAFARPALWSPIAERAGVALPAREAWLRATGLSIALLGTLALIELGAPDARWIAEPATFAVVIAAALDVLADARAHRAALVRVWSLQQAQHADLVEAQLRDAGIACHLSATSVRTLLAWFGPFAPIEVWVPPANAVDARARIAALVA